MGWNDRNPELYEAITGLDYGTDRPLDSRSRPFNGVLPAMPEKCDGCGTTGDTIENPIYTGECECCEVPLCVECADCVDCDEGGTTLWCKIC